MDNKLLKYILLILILFFLINCVKEKNKFTIIFIGSEQCNACTEMKNTLNEISKQYNNKIKIIFYDIESTEGIAKYKEYNGRSIPFTVFFNQNQKKIFLANSKIEKDAIIAILKAEGFK